jgi:AraC-like DNA-binding protein
MAYFKNKPSLIQLSSSLDFNFSHICTAVFEHHITTVFTANILLLVLDDDGKNNCFFEDLENGRKFPLLKDNVYFFPCGMKLKMDITPGITTLAFRFNLMYLHVVDVFSSAKLCGMRHDPDFTKRIYALINEEENELKAACALKSEVMNFCLPFWSEDNVLRLPVIQKYEPIFRFIHEYGNAKLTVGVLAEQAKLRQDVFSRAFSRDVGRSPKEFIQEDLVRKISLRLLSPGATVKGTANELEFSSEFYMSYFFKKHTGNSPRQFQNKFRKINS